jgi:hypothetical protein
MWCLNNIRQLQQPLSQAINHVLNHFASVQVVELS